ncbi:MAG TPA: peptide deformylase [Candidatus Paceibacterota bacterium]|nr:peptide deformylase [Candidatus Paceibacterota bacterium]
MENELYVVNDKKEEVFLRTKTRPFTINKEGALSFDGQVVARKDMTALLQRMRRIMRIANGVGLSANQIGLPYRLFVAQVPDAQGALKFYAIFNPELEKVSPETTPLEEGCLSIPGAYGNVDRAKQVTLTGLDKHGRPLRIKAWGLLARVFQHEVDHLNGKLFIDRTKDIHYAETA